MTDFRLHGFFTVHGMQNTGYKVKSPLFILHFIQYKLFLKQLYS